MARPRIEIDWEDFDKLCGLQCTQLEIANWFECSVDTISRAVKREHDMSFAEYFEQKRGRGKIGLRRWQAEAAKKGNTAMLIWLGKQWLGQSEFGSGEAGANDPTLEADLDRLLARLAAAREEEEAAENSQPTIN